MKVIFRLIGTIGLAVAIAAPASASVSLAIDGTFLNGSAAVNQAIAGISINPRFTAGLLLTMDAATPSTSYTMSQQYFYTVSPSGMTTGRQDWWGYAINKYSLTSQNYNVVFDHDRSDANDPTYPVWAIPSGNKLLILFDWGVVPQILRFDLAGQFEEQRDFSFQGVRVGGAQPFPDSENITSTLRPNSLENGTIDCTSTSGPETVTATTNAGFRPTTYTHSVSAQCSLAIDVGRYLAVTPPPVIDPAAAVPEPATWATMIFGFGAVGAASRRRRSLLGCDIQRGHAFSRA